MRFLWYFYDISMIQLGLSQEGDLAAGICCPSVLASCYLIYAQAVLKWFWKWEKIIAIYSKLPKKNLIFILYSFCFLGWLWFSVSQDVKPEKIKCFVAFKLDTRGNTFSEFLCKHRKNCECCHHHSVFKGHNVIVHIVVLNCQKCNQCLKCQVSGHKNCKSVKNEWEGTRSWKF